MGRAMQGPRFRVGERVGESCGVVWRVADRFESSG